MGGVETAVEEVAVDNVNVAGPQVVVVAVVIGTKAQAGNRVKAKVMAMAMAMVVVVVADVEGLDRLQRPSERVRLARVSQQGCPLRTIAGLDADRDFSQWPRSMSREPTPVSVIRLKWTPSSVIWLDELCRFNRCNDLSYPLHPPS